jgi:hypothetical protein
MTESLTPVVTAGVPVAVGVPTLESLKARALEGRRRAAAAEAEAQAVEERSRRLEWARVLEAVERDHPYLRGVIDERNSEFTGHHAGDPYDDREVDEPTLQGEATLFVAVPQHEPVALKYARGYGHGDERWVQVSFGRGDDKYRVAVNWEVAVDRPDGVKSDEWAYASDLGEALLIAKDSYDERCLRTKQAIRVRDQKFADSRRKGRRQPPTFDERLAALALDLFQELRDRVAAQEASADTADLADEGLPEPAF